jgi:hypothetical protein
MEENASRESLHSVMDLGSVLKGWSWPGIQEWNRLVSTVPPPKLNGNRIWRP